MNKLWDQNPYFQDNLVLFLFFIFWRKQFMYKWEYVRISTKLKKNSNHSAAFIDLEVNGSYDQCLKVLRSLTNVLKIGASLPQPLTPISNTQILFKKKYTEVTSLSHARNFSLLYKFQAKS